jgi:ribosome biogenesis GTPase
MIDELTVFCELHGLRPIVVLTKPDLAEPAFVEEVSRKYAALDYAVFVCAPKHGLGIDPLRAELERHASLLVGPSGVGKSSLFRAFGGEGLVGTVSERSGQGRQTTTAARLYRFPAGFLIDSPGIGDFEIEPFPEDELAHAFVEFEPFLGRCRFRDCRHDTEPECAIRAAAETAAIAPSRYRSYRQIVERNRP